MEKLLNIVIGIVVFAVVAAGGLLFWSYKHPSNDFVGSKLDKDLQDWQRAESEKPDDPLVRANLGAIYADMGDYDRAIDELKVAIDLDPEGWTYMEKLGEVYLKAERIDEAIATLREALDKYPQEGKFLPAYQLAEIYFERGDLRAARDYVNQAIVSDDTKWNFHYLLGQIDEKEGDLEGAKKEYKYASQFSRDPGLKQALARVS